MYNESDLGIIEECRKLFGKPGARRFSFFDRMFYMSIKRPAWCDSRDDLFGAFKQYKQIFENGVVVMAHLVQANTLLFEPGPDNCPASVVFCPDPKVSVDPEVLSSVASSMFKLKGTDQEDEELRKIAAALTNEMTRTFGVKVPKQFSSGLNLVEATTFVTRKHLPQGVLVQALFPIVVSPFEPHYNFPLPSRYWSPKLLDFWNG